MIRFLQPEWLWLLALLPLVMLLRGRRGPVAAIEFSDVGLAREVARSSRARAGRWLWLLPHACRRAHDRRPRPAAACATAAPRVTANGIDIVLGLDVSGSMQALDFQIEGQRVNRIEVVKSVVSKFIDQRPNDRIGLIAFAAAPYLVSRSLSITTGCSRISSASARPSATTTAPPSARPSPRASTVCAPPTRNPRSWCCSPTA